MKKLILLQVCLFFACTTLAQELARRPFLGVRLKDIDEDTKRVMQLNDQQGVLVQNVIANSSAEKAGFKTGDILKKINGSETNSGNGTVKFIGALTTGSNFSYELVRAGKTIKGKAMLYPLPEEKYEDIDMKYTSVNTVNGLQRLIVSKPRDTKKHPVIVFIGGIGCYSLDFPFENDRSEVLLLNKLTRDGNICVRAEKPGVGDNGKCTPCNEVSFLNEVAGYVSAVNEIKKYDYVDSSRVYIIGHSMGGVMAPLIAQKTNLAGIIAYGTIGSNFLEYLAKTRRTLALAYEMNPEETDDYIREWSECAGYYFVEGLTTEEASKKKPACKDILSVFDYRSPAYNKELYALNIPGAWKTFKGKALLMWGESDFVASKEDHQIIVNTINFYNKGAASFVAMPATSHGMSSAASFVDALKDESKYNPEVGVKISNWLKNEG